MGFLAAYGVPMPTILAMAVWYAQLRLVWGMVQVQHAVMQERKMHLALSPSEQIRRHMKTGGYRP